MVAWYHLFNGCELGELWKTVGQVLQPMGLQRVGHNLVTEQQKQRGKQRHTR